ncbi:hypothetical protein B0T26DRAFT_670138 [Lasiosphaeria miniovina]|uniref:DUF1996 domain-containing protein n=1 Tax=Lasiosphaeria miniovina TaxID=1954250 RepID=A0AA40BGE3_9PEZI|nr:uncharacterized protein B0T26DRAFT_670138 [Lasiosphaeria miniovina]KAK0733767.1 hypothetical protein B0T26DRAFT_670138 [Lasiosphaeria miniovina]
MSYATRHGWRCPASHPKQVPQIALEQEFYAGSYRHEDIALSSGSKLGAGVHGDFFMGWTPTGVATMLRALDDPQCQRAAGILPWYNDESRIQRPVAALPGCNPLFDAPGLPDMKPACAGSGFGGASVPKIDPPSRLFAWRDGDPRHVVHSLGVFDQVAPSSSSRTTLLSVAKTTVSAASKTASTTKTTPITTTKTAASPTTKTTKTTTVPTGARRQPRLPRPAAILVELFEAAIMPLGDSSVSGTVLVLIYYLFSSLSSNTHLLDFSMRFSHVLIGS